jgi:hypothetical protein
MLTHARRGHMEASGLLSSPFRRRQVQPLVWLQSYCDCVTERKYPKTLGPCSLHPHGFHDNLLRIKVISSAARKRPPLWSNGQRSWFDSRRYHIFWEVVGQERGPLSLLSTTEELLERKSSGSGLEIREYGRRDPSRWPRDTLYPQILALTLPTSGGRSVGITRSWTEATEIFSTARIVFLESLGWLCSNFFFWHVDSEGFWRLL